MKFVRIKSYHLELSPPSFPSSSLSFCSFVPLRARFPPPPPFFLSRPSVSRPPVDTPPPFLSRPALSLVLLLLSSCSLVLPPVSLRPSLLFLSLVPFLSRTFFPLPLSLFLSTGTVPPFSPTPPSAPLKFLSLSPRSPSPSLASFVASPLYLFRMSEIKLRWGTHERG
jgi:hypothetical protein